MTSLYTKIEQLTTRELVKTAIKKTLKSDHPHKSKILSLLFVKLSEFPNWNTELTETVVEVLPVNRDVGHEAYLDFTYNVPDFLKN